MTKNNVIDRVNDYNEKFRSMTANKAQDTYASILTDTDKLNAEVKTAALEKLIDTIRDTCNTGHVGDGKIFVSELMTAIKIRTGERGGDAIIDDKA